MIHESGTKKTLRATELGVARSTLYYRPKKPDKDWTAERMWRSYFEFLETDDEYIEYPLQSITKQGNWRVFGIQLPPEVLEKIYFRNAERLIPPEATVIARLDALEGQRPEPSPTPGTP